MTPAILLPTTNGGYSLSVPGATFWYTSEVSAREYAAAAGYTILGPTGAGETQPDAGPGSAPPPAPGAPPTRYAVRFRAFVGGGKAREWVEEFDSMTARALAIIEWSGFAEVADEWLV